MSFLAGTLLKELSRRFLKMAEMVVVHQLAKLVFNWLVKKLKKLF